MNNFVWNPVMNAVSTVAGLSPSQTHGPLVKTGPTRNQNRTHNKTNGRWRKKRSDAGIPRHLFY